MFIGEQRYAEEFIRKFMDFFSKSSNKKIWVQLDLEKLEPTNPKEEENDSQNDELNKTNQESIKPDDSNDDENVHLIFPHPPFNYTVLKINIIFRRKAKKNQRTL